MVYAIAAVVICSLIVVGFWPRLLRRLLPARRILGLTSAVQVDEIGVECVYADGESRRLTWAALGAVRVRTTPDGPVDHDLFWDLYDRSGALQLIVPGGFHGSGDLLVALQRLPGFDNEAVVRASGSTDAEEFLVWEAAPAA